MLNLRGRYYCELDHVIRGKFFNVIPLNLNSSNNIERDIQIMNKYIDLKMLESYEPTNNTPQKLLEYYNGMQSLDDI